MFLEIFQTSKFLSKIKKKLSKIRFFVKSRNFCQKSKFLSKVEIFVKSEMFVKNQNFCLKSKFFSKIQIFVQNPNFCQKSKVFLKSKFLSKIQFFVKNPKFFQKTHIFTKKSYFLYIFSFYNISIYFSVKLPFRFIPDSKHFLSLQYWHRFRCFLDIIHCLSREHRYTRRLQIDRLKKPLQPKNKRLLVSKSKSKKI